MASSEKLDIRGKAIELLHLGGRKVEFFLANLSKELQEELKTAVCQTSYVNKEETELTEQGALVCKIKEEHKLKFEQLVKKVANVMVTRMEHHDKRPTKSKHKSRGGQKGKKKSRGGYRSRGALAT